MTPGLSLFGRLNKESQMNAKSNAIKVLIAVLMVGAGSPVMAQQPKAAKELSIVAHNITADDAAKAGKTRTDSKALPGDVMEYQLVFTNTKSFAIKNVTFADPIPAGLQYIASSAKSTRSDVAVEYSIDSGKTWSSQPMVEVMENGAKVKKPASPEQYTNVRWKVAGEVAPGATVEARFRTRVSANNK